VALPNVIVRSQRRCDHQARVLVATNKGRTRAADQLKGGEAERESPCLGASRCGTKTATQAASRLFAGPDLTPAARREACPLARVTHPMAEHPGVRSSSVGATDQLRVRRESEAWVTPTPSYAECDSFLENTREDQQSEREFAARIVPTVRA